MFQKLHEWIVDQKKVFQNCHPDPGGVVLRMILTVLETLMAGKDSKDLSDAEAELYCRLKTGQWQCCGFLTRGEQPFPPEVNPYKHDLFNMGTSIGDEIEVMWGAGKGGSRKPETLIIVHKPTGKRCRVYVPKTTVDRGYDDSGEGDVLDPEDGEENKDQPQRRSGAADVAQRHHERGELNECQWRTPGWDYIDPRRES